MSEIKMNYEDAANKALLLTMAIPVKVLHDKYGWRRCKRLPDFADAIIEEFQNFQDGTMSLQDYELEVYKHPGIRFKKDG